MSQLIILGNGFDLQRGLKSSFKDFFECCLIDDIETIIKEIPWLINFGENGYEQTDAIYRLINIHVKLSQIKTKAKS